jgi:AraC-like DNA-binding protein
MMFRRTKIGRNDPCPCQTGKKFKHCCYGKVDWETIREQHRDYRPYLSIRGRNLYFANRIGEALQFDTLGKARSLRDYKAAFTPEAVRRIHEAVMEVWPPDINIHEVLHRESGDVSGLYIGDYGPEYIARGIVRHSVYANRILLVDPFIYPISVRDEFNPILNPAQYRTQTLRNVNLWFALIPWIAAGIVQVIRTPSDFDHRLNWEIMESQRRKFEENAELKQSMESSVDELERRHRPRLMRLMLSAPDSYLRTKFQETGLGKHDYTVDDFLKSIHEEREQDPDFLEPLGSDHPESELYTFSTGASYPSATMTANITGSYLFTDLDIKWKEIELDRQSHSAENKVWAPFAKALQNAPLRYLNSLRLEHALTLRREGRLESLRGFLGKVWRDASKENQFDNANATLLAEELGERIRDAEQEWKQIDRDLLKMVRTAAVGGLLSAGPLIAAGHALFLAAAVAVAGVGALTNSTLQRRSFPDRFPAAFFMRVQEDEP